MLLDVQMTRCMATHIVLFGKGDDCQNPKCSDHCTYCLQVGCRCQRCTEVQSGCTTRKSQACSTRVLLRAHSEPVKGRN